MGVLYIVIPLTQDVAGWLHESGTPRRMGSPSRGANLLEIRETLDSLEGFSVEINDGGIGGRWQAMITSIRSPESGGWTLMNITKRGETEQPQEIWFEKGCPGLIVDIVCRLSARCGTLVVITDTGCAPLVISPSDDSEELCGRWEHLAPDS